MTDNRLVCIRTTDVTQVIRYDKVPLSEAKQLVSSGDWCFISKSKYKRHLKELQKVKDKLYIQNENAKPKIPRIQKYYEGIDKTKLPKPDKDGNIETKFATHEAIVHWSEPCPQTGKRVKTKEGRGIVKKIVRNILKKR